MFGPHHVQWQTVHNEFTLLEQRKFGIPRPDNPIEHEAYILSPHRSPHTAQDQLRSAKQVHIILVNVSIQANVVCYHNRGRVQSLYLQLCAELVIP